MRDRKTIYLLLLALILSVCICGFGIGEEYSGEMNGVHWALSDDGTLFIEVDEDASLISKNSSDIPWDEYRNQINRVNIQGACTDIWQYAFCGCQNLTSIAIPDTVTYIHGNAFSECSSLTDVNLSDNLQIIDRYAFRNCTSLTHIEIPETVTFIGRGALYNCPLVSLSIPFIGENIYETNGLNENSLFGSIFGYSTVNSDSVTVDDAVYQYHGPLFYYWYAIPSTLRSVIVTNAPSIPERAFINCKMLTSITINDDVSSIGEMAFADCTNLSSFNIPDGLTTIEKGLFAGCSNLTNVFFPSTIENIKASAFAGCIKLNNISLGSSVRSIGDSAFMRCSSLDGIILPEGLEVIDYGAFSGCTALTEIIIPQSVTYIGKSALSNTSLINLTVPFIGNYASDELQKNGHLGDIFGCRTLGSSTGSVDGAVLQHIEIYDETDCVMDYFWYYIPSTLRKVTVTDSLYIPSEAFWNCSFLNEIRIPNNTKMIGESAFKNCTGLRTFNMPESLTAIEKESFYNCSNLGSIVLPNNLTRIGDHAFYNCSSLEINDLPQELMEIDDCAFMSCSRLTSISIPAKMSVINKAVFRGCTGLRRVFTGENTSVIRWNAFTDCISLEDVEFGENLNAIYSEAFKGCSSLSGVNLPTSLETIGGGAFSGCNSITSITVPKSVIDIGEGAFNIVGLQSLSVPFVGRSREAAGYDAVLGYLFGYRTLSSNTGSVDGAINQIYYNTYYYWYYIPSTLTSVTITDTSVIPDYAFNKCTNISEINIVSEVTSIGKNAFNGCSIDSFNIPDSVTLIDDGAFGGTNLTSIIIPRRVSMIGAYAFFGTPIQSLILPEELKSIGECAFSNCKHLSSVTFPSGLQTIDNYAFSGCSGISALVIPNSVNYIGIGAFAGMNSLNQISIPFVGNSTVENGYRAVFGIIFNYGTVNSSTASKDGGTLQFYDGYFTYYWYYIPQTLQRVKITGNVKIPENAFKNCSNIKELILEGQITEIGKDAFTNTAITRVDIPSMDSWLNISFSNSNSKPNSSIYVAGELLTEVIVPEGTECINAYTFCNDTNITSITLPNSIRRIDHEAFHACSKLSTVTYDGDLLDKSKIIIGSNNAALIDAIWKVNNYGKCGQNLTYEIDGQGVLSIVGNGNMMDFSDGIQPWDPSAVTEIILPDGLTSIGEYGFANCVNVASLILPIRIESIGANAFAGCSSLLSIIIPNGVTSINDGTFAGCERLEIHCHDQIETIAANAFGSNGSVDVNRIYCRPLTITSASCGRISVPFFLDEGEYKLIEEEGQVRVLNYSGSYESVSMPDNIKSWNNDSIQIQNIKLPKTLDASCSFMLSATNVTIPDCVENLGVLTLNNLQRIIIPSSVVNLDHLTVHGVAPVVYCYFDSDAELWAMANDYEIIYLDDVRWSDVYSLSYVGEAIDLDVNESYTFESSDFMISPIPVGDETVAIVCDDSVTNDGLTITANKPGNHTISAVFQDIYANVPIHIYQPITSFDVVAPRFVEKGKSFEVRIENIEPEDTSEKFTWQKDGNVIYADGETCRNFTIDQKPGSVQMTIIASSGVSRTVTVAVPENISAPYASSNSQNAVIGAVINICVDVDEQTYYDDPELYKGISINSTAAKMIKEMPDHRILVTAAGRCAFTVYGYDGTQVNIRVVATEPSGVLTLPSAVKVIDDEAFMGVVAQKIVIPEGCQRIGENAFAESNDAIACIPSSVKTIAKDAFNGCNNLTVITDAETGSVVEWCERKGVDWYCGGLD